MATDTFKSLNETPLDFSVGRGDEGSLDSNPPTPPIPLHMGGKWPLAAPGLPLIRPLIGLPSVQEPNLATPEVLAMARLKSNPTLALRKMQAVAAAVTASKLSSPIFNDTPTELQKVNQESMQQYNYFRENMLRQLTLAKLKRRRRSNSPTNTVDMSLQISNDISNPSSPSTNVSATSSSNDTSSSSPESGQETSASTPKRARRDDHRDEAYWERRKKNNEAAKRSRDARRAKEDEIAIRAAFLEQENVQLKWEVARLKTETCRLKALFLSEDESKD